LIIEVEDSGPGIAPEDQQRVFEPFVQLGALADNKGTGLGLTITREFVRLMKGTLTLQSTPGKGTLFRIDLPLRQAEESDISTLHRSDERDVTGLAPGQPDWRILIVEDQLENQLLLANLMESVGFQIKVAENGRQGVELFQTWRPHFIWMDRLMPVMDGIEATKAIRGLPGGNEVKIVAVTASAFEEQREGVLDAGMDDFVRKPYRADEIYECLSRQLGVRYAYSAHDKPAEASMELAPEALSVLPEALRRELEAALESLESERIEIVVGQVARYDKELFRSLTRLAQEFDYPAILKALRTN
jgi:CheY-like chemotaxis protein